MHSFFLFFHVYSEEGYLTESAWYQESSYTVKLESALVVNKVIIVHEH